MFKFLSDIEEHKDGTVSIEWEYEGCGRMWEKYDSMKEAEEAIDAENKFKEDNKEAYHETLFKEEAINVFIINDMMEYGASEYEVAFVKWYEEYMSQNETTDWDIYWDAKRKFQIEFEENRG